MNKVFYILILGGFLNACTSNTIIKKPDNLIPKEQMVDVLTDMLLASGGGNIKNKLLHRKVNYFPFVFEKHQIDSTRFKESDYYYISKIDEHNEILKKVEIRLKALKKVVEKEKKIQDSLKRVATDLERKKRTQPLKSVELELPKK